MLIRDCLKRNVYYVPITILYVIAYPFYAR